MFVFSDEIILFTRLSRPQQIIPTAHKPFQRSDRLQKSHTKSVAFLNTEDEMTDKVSRETTPTIVASKEHWNKPNHRRKRHVQGKFKNTYKRNREKH